METKSNHIIVGAVTLLLLAALAGFTIWLSRWGEGDQKEYDIFFQSSVNGLNKGSGVSYAGVPIGKVQEIKLSKTDPDFVRVRISVDEKVQILQGTVATISGIGFTGVSEIQLDGGIKGAPKILCPKVNPRASCPEGKPIIPTKPGALGELLNNAPLLLERLSTLTERLSNLLSDKNQESFGAILTNVQTLSGSLAASGPELQATIAQSRETLAKAGAAADQLSALAGNANGLLDGEGKALVAELKKTLSSANSSLATIDHAFKNTEPAFNTLAEQTLPEVNQLTRDLRQVSQSLKSITDKLDQDGAASLIGSPALPDYDPKKKK